MEEKRGPWTIKSRVSVFKNYWLELFDDRAERADGKVVDRQVVVLRPGVTVVALDKDDTIYLAKEFRYALNDYLIGCAIGGIDDGETALFAAQRELEEELGVQARSWHELGVVNSLGGRITSPQYSFLAQDLVLTKQRLEDTESIQVLKMPLQEALEMIFKGEITDSQSCITILKAAKYLGKL